MRAGGANRAEPGGGRGGRGPRALGTAFPLWVRSPVPTWKIGKFAWGQGLADRLRRTDEAESKARETETEGREKDIQRGRQRDRAEKAVKESEQPKEQKAHRARNSGAEIQKKAVGKNAPRQRQKPHSAETQAPAENASDPSRFCLIWKILLRS